MNYPRTYPSTAVARSVRKLVDELLPRLIEGPHVALEALRAQLPHLQIVEVQLTGVGFYADLRVPANLPLAVPASFAGGNAEIELTGAPYGAGCVLFVRDGLLATLEGYTHDGEWTEDAEVIDVKNVSPIVPDA